MIVDVFINNSLRRELLNIEKKKIYLLLLFINNSLWRKLFKWKMRLLHFVFTTQAGEKNWSYPLTTTEKKENSPNV